MAVATLALIEPPAANAASGDLDTTFASTGVYGHPDFDAQPGLTGLAVTDDGRPVLLGPSGSPPTAAQTRVSRLRDDGILDGTFGAGTGRQYFQAGDATYWEEPKAVDLDSNGRIVTLVSLYDDVGGPAQPHRFHVRRVAADGSPADVNHLYDEGPVLAKDLAVDASSRILVAGADIPGDSDLTVMRLRGGLTSPNGKDTGFGTTGIQRLVIEGTHSSANAVTLAGTRVLLGGGTHPFSVTTRTKGKWVVARLLGSGQPDTTFSGDGIVTIVPPGGYGAVHDIAADAAGGIIAVGVAQTCSEAPTAPCAASARPAVARFLANGALDTAFGVNGWAVLPSSMTSQTGELRTVAVDPAGWIVAGGTTGLASSVLRLTPYGHPDPGFGTGGVVLRDPHPGAGAALPHGGVNRITVDPSGRYVAAGYARSNAGFTGEAMRLLGGGTPPSAPPPTVVPPAPSPAVQIAKPRRKKVKAITGTAGPAGSIRSVEVGLQRIDKRLLKSKRKCRWAKSAKPRFGKVKATKITRKKYRCDTPRWLAVPAGGSWQLAFKKKLPKGKYVAHVRVTLTTGQQARTTRTFKAR